MLNKTALLLFVGLLTVVSSLNTTLVENFYNFHFEDSYTQPFLNVNNKVLTYNLEDNDFPQYLSIDLKTNNYTTILQATMAACGHGLAVFNRVFYHSDSSTLVYYCTANNTLLILDQGNYTVQGIIPTNVTTIFNETRLYAEGTSVVILGMISPFKASDSPSELVKINLANQQVVRHVTFFSGLEANETVTSYLSKGLLSFILTKYVNTTDYKTTTSIYSAIFVGNFYQLTLLVSFTSDSPKGLSLYSELLCLGTGNYLVTNDDKSILFYNAIGKLAHNTTGLKFLGRQQSLIPAFAMHSGGSNLYAQFQNGTVNTYSITGTSLVWHAIPDADEYINEIHITLGDQNNNHDLLFLRSPNYFKILDLQTLEIIYLDFEHYDSLYFTDSKCIVRYNNTYVIYDLQTYQQITTFSYNSNNSYYEEINRNIFYSDIGTNKSCQLKYYEVDSHTFGTAFNFNNLDYCIDVQITHVRPSTETFAAEMVLLFLNNRTYLFVTNVYGQLQFPVPGNTGQLFVPDYDNASFYYVVPMGQLLFWPYYYNTTTDQFVSPYYSSFDFYPTLNQMIILDTNIIAAIDKNGINFGVFNLSSITSQVVKVSLTDFSKFGDSYGNNYIVASGTNNNFYLYANGQLNKLPNTDNYTVDVQASGMCTYSVIGVDKSNIVTRRVYNVCPTSEVEDTMSIISL